MSTITIEELKDKFSAGKYPKEKDYENLIDALSLPGISVAAVSENEPADAQEGSLWFNTIDLSLYVFVEDFWVEVG